MSTPPGTPDPQAPPPEQPQQSASQGPPPGAPAAPPPMPPTGGQPAGGQNSPFAGIDADQAKTAFQNAHKFDLGILAAALLTFFFSFLPYYTVELKGFKQLGLTVEGASDSVTAWHGFFGWFGALVALAVGVVLALHLMGVKLPFPTRLVALAGFAVSLVCLFFALFIIPGGDCGGVQACEDALDFGHGIGYWLSVITVLAGLVLSFLRKDAED